MFCSNYTELPKPDLGDITDIKAATVQAQKRKSAAILGLKYEELVAMDTISVDLVPEKKGILLKHNEYSVHSQVSFCSLLFVHSFLFIPFCSRLFVHSFLFIPFCSLPIQRSRRCKSLNMNIKGDMVNWLTEISLSNVR